MTAVAINRGYTNATAERLREELQKRDKDLISARERIAELEEALLPFAHVIGWIDDCQSHDRNIRLGTTFLNVGTGAFTSGYSIGADSFNRAGKAMRGRY